MRKKFAEILYNHMYDNSNIILVTGDLGYGVLNKIKDDFPDQYYNVGASEQAGMGVCVGLALSGKIPLFYSITPFSIWRPAETIRIYLDHEQIPVKIIGTGRGEEYSLTDGFSHDATDTKALLNLWPSIQTYFPEKEEYLEEVIKFMLYNDKPSFLSLRR